MSADKRIILITGGNAGIGYETAAQLIAEAKSNHVIIGSRSAAKGAAALKVLQAMNQPGSVEMVELDVSKRDSIKSAAKKVESDHGRLDALVNNAGVAFGFADNVNEEWMRQCYETNCIGTAIMVEEFAPLLAKSTATPRIVNVSSGVGSIGRKLDRDSPMYKVQSVHYRASKSGMNMVTVCQAAMYEDQGFKVFAYCPGFTVSNLGSSNTEANGAHPTSVGAKPILTILSGERDAEHAGFLHKDGQYPW